jgi:hypothetical protein
MLKLELVISNDAANAAAQEIEHFLRFETGKLSGNFRDRDDTAALGYVVLRQVLGKIRAHQDEIERQENARVRASYPSIRERRGVRR